MATNKYAEFTAIIEAMESDFEKFYDKEVGAAGTRFVNIVKIWLSCAKKLVTMLQPLKTLVKKPNKSTKYKSKALYYYTR